METIHFCHFATDVFAIQKITNDANAKLPAAWPLGNDGSVGAAVKFVNASSDGMVLDCAGNLYTTNANQATVDIYSPAGMKIGSVTGVGSCTNVAFGGANRKTLYITSSAGPSPAVYSAELAVPGFPY